MLALPPKPRLPDPVQALSVVERRQQQKREKAEEAANFFLAVARTRKQTENQSNDPVSRSSGIRNSLPLKKRPVAVIFESGSTGTKYKRLQTSKKVIAKAKKKEEKNNRIHVSQQRPLSSYPPSSLGVPKKSEPEELSLLTDDFPPMKDETTPVKEESSPLIGPNDWERDADTVREMHIWCTQSEFFQEQPNRSRLYTPITKEDVTLPTEFQIYQNLVDSPPTVHSHTGRVKRSICNWFRSYISLRSFKKEHGHDNVPQKEPLGRWVHRVRDRLKGSEKWCKRMDPVLWEVMKKLLDEIKFTPSMAEKGARFNKRMKQLLEYKKEFGDCDVPIKSGSLGRWVSCARKKYKDFKNKKDNRLSEQENKRLFEALDAIGFSWELKPGRKDIVQVYKNSNESRVGNTCTAIISKKSGEIKTIIF